MIDPWGSEDVKEEKLMNEFGIEKFSGFSGKIPDNLLMRRGIIFGQMDFGKIADCIKNRKKFVMMTGLMPSGAFHLGHKIVADQIIYYQKLGAKIYLCVADVEAYNMRLASLEKLRRIAIEEYLTNYIALGLRPKNCDFYFQSNRSSSSAKANAYYRLISMIPKKVTLNELKAIYGDLSPGKIISVMHQVSDILHSQLKEFEDKGPVVVPVGIDQAPHLRLTRDVAARFSQAKEFDFILPSSTYHKFMKGLRGGKMSSSDPTSFIALTDGPKTAREKIIKHAFSGGRDTVEEHREKGGVPEVDISYQMLYYMFEPDDKKIKKIYEDYKSGKILTGELKQILTEKIAKFLIEHKEKREKARDKVHEFIS